MSHQKEKDSYYDMARDTLIRIPGYERYFAEKLVTDKRQGIIDGRTFDLLSLLGTPEIQVVLAPYLFDFEVIPGDGDIRPSVIAPVAGLALDHMHLLEAPPKANPSIQTAKDLLAWQEWAIRKQLVPASSQAGVPAGLFGVADPGAKPVTPSAPPASRARPSASSEAPESSSPEVAEAQPPSSQISRLNWGWMAIGILCVTFLLFVVRLLRRSP